MWKAVFVIAVAMAAVEASHVQTAIARETNDWVISPTTGFEYRRYRYRLNWWDARTACRREGGDLASWSNLEEFNWMWNTVAPMGGWTTSGGNWVGHDDSAKEGTFVMSDGSAFEEDTRYWGSREPNNWGGGEDCATLGWGRRGKLNDWKCRYSIPFICKKQAKISISPTTVTMNKGESTTISVVLKRPITCEGNRTDCDVVLRFTNNHVDELLVSPCGLQFNIINWNVPQTVTITAIDDFKDQDETSITYTVVTEPLESSDPVFSGLNPSDIAINRQPPISPATCASTGDPHLTTFDGKKFDWMGVGTVSMVSATHRDVTVQARVWKCFRVSCNCGLAIREGGNLFTIDACGGELSLAAATSPVTTLVSVVPEDQKAKYGAKVTRRGSTTLNVKFPSGVVATVRYQRWGISYWLNFPGTDMNKNMDGLCGNFDGDSSDDYFLERSNRYSLDPAYRVKGNENLFRYSYPDDYEWTAPLLPEEPDEAVLDRLQCTTVFDPPDIPVDDDEDDVTDDIDDDNDDDDDDFPDDGGPNDTTTPAPPSWPTPTGITEQQANDACWAKIRDFAGYQLCLTEFISELGATEANQFVEALIAQCVADIQRTEDIPETTNTLFNEFVIKCNEFVADNTCPDDCNGQGTCNKLTRQCACNEGWAPPECATELNTPPVINSISPIGCDIGSSGCDTIRLLGSNILQSEGLLCHYEVGSETRTLAGTFNFAFQASCPVLNLAKGPVPVSYTVALSNQGTDASDKFTFTEYDSACAGPVTVDGITVIQQLPATEFCAIPSDTGDLCVADEEYLSECSQCQPTVDNTALTRDIEDPACVVSIFASTISVSVDENVVPSGVLSIVSFTNGKFKGEEFAVTYSVDNPLFAIANDGSVTFVGTTGLDFETTPSVTVTATVTEQSDWAFADSVDIVLSVNDVNEQPTAITLSGDKNFDENSAAGEVIGTVTVADPDAGQTHILVVGGTDAALFAINSNNELVFTGDANHEKKAQYSITITATDSGSPALSLSADFLIDVNDVAESPISLIVSLPSTTVVRRSTASVTELTIDENSAESTLVGVVTAIDEDENEDVAFTLTGTGDCPVKFAGSTCTHNEVIDGVTVTKCSAQIQINTGSLDFEGANSFSCQVTAKDTSDRSISAIFALTVVDVAEKPTAANFQNSPVAVAENAPVGTVVGTIVVSDEDASNTHELEIVGDVPFAFSDDTAQIVVNGPLDHETTPSYTFDIRVIDGAFSEDFSVTVTVNDVNEVPTCDDQTFSLPEDSNIGTTLPIGGVAPVYCSDPDDDTITYSLLTESASGFAVDAETGAVSTTATLDFEGAPSHQLFISASDGVGLAAVYTVTITVENVEEIPEFVGTCADSIEENVASASLPQSLQRPQAVDPDGNPITYSLATPTAGQDDVSGIFSVASDGTISSLVSLDFETKNEYVFSVSASDGTSQTTATCTITVVDVNDAPELVPYVGDDVNVALTEPVTSIVYQMEVSDQDTDISGHVYTLSAPSFLTIDAVSGIVTIASDPLDIFRAEDLLANTLTITATLQDGTFSISESIALQFGDHCSPYPCQANYACMDYANTQDTDCTTCPRHVRDGQPYDTFTGFEGTTCEEASDACSPNPCPAGEVCTNLPLGEFACGCPAGTRGVDCSKVDAVACDGIDCKNGGVCRAAIAADGVAQEWFCLCPATFVSDSFKGGVCEVDAEIANFLISFGFALESDYFFTDPEDYAAALAELTGVPEGDIIVTANEQRRSTGTVIVYTASIRVGADRDPEEFAATVKKVLADGSLAKEIRRKNPDLPPFELSLTTEPEVTEFEQKKSTDSEKSSNSGGDDNNTLIIGVVAGVAALMIALVVGLVMYTKRQQYAKMDYYSDQPLALGSTYQRPANGLAIVVDEDDEAEEKRIKADNPEYMSTGWAARPSGRSFRSNATAEDMKLTYVFPEMTRKEANAQFYSPSHQQNGVFLMRQKPTTFVLSVVSNGSIVHTLLQLGTDGLFKIDSKPFSSPCRTLRNVITHLQAKADLIPTKLSSETASKRSDQWLVEEVSRDDAESKLKQRGMKEGDFLVRQKEVSDYVLSVFSAKKGRVEHHLVRRSRGGYRVNSCMLEPRCKSVEEVVTHLRQHLDGISVLLTESVYDVTAADNEQRGGYFDVTPDSEPAVHIPMEANADADADEMDDADDVVTVPDLPTLAARVETFKSAMARNKVFTPEFNTLRWYHPEVTAQEAQEFVATQKSGTFLIYGSKKQFLCVQTVSSVLHCPLECNVDSGEVTLTLPEEFVSDYGFNKQPYHADMPALVEYYQLPRAGIPFELLDNKRNPMYQVAAIERRHRLSSFAATQQGSVRTRPSLDVPGAIEEDVFQRKLSKRTSEDLEFFKPLVLGEEVDEGSEIEEEEEADTEEPWMATNETFDGFGTVNEEYLQVEDNIVNGGVGSWLPGSTQ